MKRSIVFAAVVTLMAFTLCAAWVAGQDSSQTAKSSDAQTSGAAASGPQGRRRGVERGPRLFGTIGSVGVDRFEVKREDGTTQTVTVSDQTRYREDQKDIHLEDLKPGDRVMVQGQSADNNQIAAGMVRRVTEEDMQRFQQMQAHRAFGQIVSIEGNQLKIQNPRQGERTIVVNDQTTFTKDGQSITLKDLKVGDRIFASGDETNGQFVATRVASGQFRRGQGRPPRE
ncbi:MAG TPA: DUF5666 domain-containing protein [Terriglobia bacterium]|nr:DUF5666 domain-containing protein [Terriglobia bacterium]